MNWNEMQIASACAVGGGLFMSLLAFQQLRSRRAFTATAAKTTGVIVDIVYQNRQRVPFPVVEFEVSGKKVRFTPQSSSSSAGWQKGQTVEVAYQPSNPENALVGGPQGDAGVQGFIFIGIIAAILGGALFAKETYGPTPEQLIAPVESGSK